MKSIEILSPKNQLLLYNYDKYFTSFIKLFSNNKLPNSILLTGSKGIGKATFAYHFINYLLSYKEESKCSLDKFSINKDNKSYISICNNTHPNFHLIDSDFSDDSSKIENIRNVLKFLSKSTYSSNIKIVLIDNAENLNINSSNALLKSLEEPSNNTFFFIINNNTYKLSNTIKSRCIEFKIFFSNNEKKAILNNLAKQYIDDFDPGSINDSFFFDSPGNILNYIKVFNINSFDKKNDKLTYILHLIDKYKQKKDPNLLNFISSFVELFYNELSLKNNKNLNQIFYNKSKIMKKIDDAKKFNLDKNNLFTSISGLLKNEKK